MGVQHEIRMYLISLALVVGLIAVIGVGMLIINLLVTHLLSLPRVVLGILSLALFVRMYIFGDD